MSEGELAQHELNHFRHVASRAAMGRYPSAVHHKPTHVATVALERARALGPGYNAFDVVLPQPGDEEMRRFRELVHAAASESARGSGLASLLPHVSQPFPILLADPSSSRPPAPADDCGGSSGAGGAAVMCTLSVLGAMLGAALLLSGGPAVHARPCYATSPLCPHRL